MNKYIDWNQSKIRFGIRLRIELVLDQGWI